MKCPHCLEGFFANTSEAFLAWMNGGGGAVADADGNWKYKFTVCPTCHRIVIWLRTVARDDANIEVRSVMVWPKGIARTPLPQEVPQDFAKEYREACNVLAESANASGALSRRCLQRLLREQAKVKPGKQLYAEIDEAVKSGTLPSYITELLLDAIRHFGNFAAHPEKDVATGEIVDVEPGEAEWCLEILEALFDFYFVQPAKTAARKAGLDAKLGKVGKPPTS